MFTASASSEFVSRVSGRVRGLVVVGVASRVLKAPENFFSGI
jgi:hypothetical protein